MVLFYILVTLNAKMNFARNYENLLNFAKGMPKILVVPFFSGHGVLTIVLLFVVKYMTTACHHGRSFWLKYAPNSLPATFSLKRRLHVLCCLVGSLEPREREKEGRGMCKYCCPITVMLPNNCNVAAYCRLSC